MRGALARGGAALARGARARAAARRGGENCVARQVSRVAAYLAVRLVCRAGARVSFNVHTEGFSEECHCTHTGHLQATTIGTHTNTPPNP